MFSETFSSLSGTIKKLDKIDILSNSYVSIIFQNGKKSNTIFILYTKFAKIAFL